MTTRIYGLIDPRDGRIRYIGKTVKNLAARLRAHICRTNLTPKRHSSRWLAGLAADGYSPEILLIEEVGPDGDWMDAERYWIAYFRLAGAELTNIVEGGEGVAGYRFSEARRAEQSERFRGRVFDTDWRAKISAAKKGVPGKPQSPEVIAKRTASIRLTRAAKAKLKTHCRRGHAWVQGQRACKACKAEYFQRTYVPKPMTREQRAAALNTTRNRADVRSKMKAAARRRWADPAERERSAAAKRGKPTGRHGEKSPLAKLNWEKVSEIRERCAAGETRASMAEQFGVSPAVVDRVVWRKTWKPENAPDARPV